MPDIRYKRYLALDIEFLNHPISGIQQQPDIRYSVKISPSIRYTVTIRPNILPDIRQSNRISGFQQSIWIYLIKEGIMWWVCRAVVFIKQVLWSDAKFYFAVFLFSSFSLNNQCLAESFFSILDQSSNVASQQDGTWSLTKMFDNSKMKKYFGNNKMYSKFR